MIESPQERQRLRSDLLEIQRLAQQITDVAQFEQILASAQDPYTQKILRALLVPLLPFAIPEADGSSQSHT